MSLGPAEILVLVVAVLAVVVPRRFPQAVRHLRRQWRVQRRELDARGAYAAPGGST